MIKKKNEKMNDSGRRQTRPGRTSAGGFVLRLVRRGETVDKKGQGEFRTDKRNPRGRGGGSRRKRGTTGRKSK